MHKISESFIIEQTAYLQQLLQYLNSSKSRPNPASDATTNKISQAIEDAMIASAISHRNSEQEYLRRNVNENK